MAATWSLQSLQAVWYPAGVSPPIGDLFSALVGVPPATTQAAQMTSVAVGQGANSVYRVQQQPGRIDFIEAPQMQQPGAFPLFSDFKGPFSKFTNSLSRVTINQATRVALVVVLTQLMPSAEDAVQLVSNQIGFQLPFQDGRDLVFQINRRRQFKSVTGLEMHRVLKWSAENFQIVGMSTGGGPPMVKSQDVSSYTVDVSNAFDTGRTFDPKEQAALFQEISDEVERLCSANSMSALV
jgi:hypothetical protein